MVRGDIMGSVSKMTGVIALVAIGASLIISPAEAAFKLEINVVGESSIEVEDNGTGDLYGTVDGAIHFYDTVGAMTLQVTGTSDPQLPAAPPQMDMLSLEISGAPGEVELRLTKTDFVGPSYVAMTGSIGGTTTGGQIKYEVRFDKDNTEYGEGANAKSSGLIGPLSVQNFAFSDSTVIDADPDPVLPFSMTQIFVVKHIGSAVTSADLFSIMRLPGFDIPAPAALPAGLALLSVAGLKRRRRA